MKDPLYIPRQELIGMNAEINAVRAQVKEHLMSFPGVLAVGAGLKQVKGKYQRKLCFKITVAEKFKKKQLTKADFIPPSLFGFETDITAVLPAGSGMLFDNTKYRPLIGGCKVEASFSPKIPTMTPEVTGIFTATGTLGCFARVTEGEHIGKIVALTCWHVAVKGNTATDNERLGQPTHNGCCSCCACNEIGKVIGGQLDGTTDAAIILLAGQGSDTTPDTRYLNEVLDIGLIAGSAVHVPGETVYKRGASGVLTRGRIASDAYMSPLITFNPGDGARAITFMEQLEITPIAPVTKFAQPGDSGSVIVNEHNQVVGLLFGGNYGTGTGWANQITGVLSQLKIEIKDETFKPDAESIHFGVPLSTASMKVSASDVLTAPFEAMEKEVTRYKTGAHLMEMFSTHQHEILDLVNNNREVMAAWNRYQGPAFLAQIIRSFHRDNKPIDEEIKGVRLQNLLLKMTAVLQRHGSSALVAAVNENYVSVMQVLTAGRLPEQWKQQLAAMENNNVS